MKKQILNFGTVLNRSQQKSILGSYTHPCPNGYFFNCGCKPCYNEPPKK